MFIPTSFRVDDRDTLFAFIERYGFATLVTPLDGAPFASHLPLLLDRETNLLLGHVSRANPHRAAFDGGSESLAVFSGPHAYVSPAWYVTAPAVPTWNYVAVHVYGVPRLLSPDRTRDVVDMTVRKYEGSRPVPWANEMPEEFRGKLLAGIVGFEMPISRIEGKFKLGQNRSAADQAGMLAGLRDDGPEAEQLAAFIESRRAGADSGTEGKSL